MFCRICVFQACILAAILAQPSYPEGPSPPPVGVSPVISEPPSYPSNDAVRPGDHSKTTLPNQTLPSSVDRAAAEHGVLGVKGMAVNELLAASATRQSLDPRDYLSYHRRDGYVPFSNESRMQTLRENGVEYALAIQFAKGASLPGIVGQQVVLVKPTGEILDRIQCNIAQRLGSGTLATEVCQEPEPDGTQVIIRIIPPPWHTNESPAWLHDGHSILFRGRDYSFGTDVRIPCAVPRSA